MDRPQFLSRLARDSKSKIVLLVLDGVGDLRTATQPKTPLDTASTPNLDDLAKRSSLGRILPVARGITPGSGPGHLSLFGFDPTEPATDIGRGVLEALGLGLEIGPRDVIARGNFATADDEGRLTDRRAGRIATEECRRLCAKLNAGLESEAGVEIKVEPGESYRFVLILRGGEFSPELADTDPQALGTAPLRPRPLTPEAEATAALVGRVIDGFEQILADEEQANRVLLRGFSRLPSLPSIDELYRLRAGAFAGYPLYRGVAAACGMAVIPCGKRFAEIVDTVAENWSDFDYFFLHVKQTDQAGEDGDARAKAAVLEEVDRALPDLLALGPDVLAITGDHSTPAPMKAHSWHPVPLLLASKYAFVDETENYSESAAVRGQLGDLASADLMGLLLAHAGRLAKFGA